jgi:hypothetical protein
MPKHRYFEELCALVSLGELSRSDCAKLDAHLADCSACRKREAEYAHVHQLTTAPAEIESVIESSRDRAKAAMWVGIAAVDEERARAAAIQPTPKLRPPWPLWAGALAGTMTIVLGVFWLGMRYERALHVNQIAYIAPLAHGASETVSHSAPAAPPNSASDPGLKTQLATLASNLEAEQTRNQDLTQKLASDDQALSQAAAARAALQQEIDQQAAAVKTTQAELEAKKTELEQAQAANSSDGATIAGLQLQVRNLSGQLDTQTASLDRERDLLSHGREIRDIIGARNLHIIDVYDTDTQGATTKPFARAFYTEGKSLVFYAYDLPERRAEEGKFSYVAWGEANGNKATVRKIGILFHDDQTQRRWSLNFADPQVLREIDSVFITLERNDGDVNQPKGKRMLTAYLGTPPNHP